jgi:hypothetical protein
MNHSLDLGNCMSGAATNSCRAFHSTLGWPLTEGRPPFTRTISGIPSAREGSDDCAQSLPLVLSVNSALLPRFI